jgi:plastocyanin
MKKLAFFMLPALIVGAFLVSGCGKAPGGQTTASGPVDHVDMTVDNWATSSITVAVNTPFKFNDPTDTGGIHVICTGSNGKCVADANAPTELGAPGFSIQPGQSKTVTFTKPGTYHIACTIHPMMDLTLVVQ